MGDGGILLLRLVLGIVMIAHGVMKFQRRPELDVKWQKDYGFPAGSVLLNGVVQVTGGLAITVGLFSQYAAAILVVNLLVATYVSIWIQHQPFLSTPEGKGWDINFLLIGGLMAIVMLGDGQWLALNLLLQG